MKELNFILSAIVHVNNNGVIHASINWNFTKSTPGMLGSLHAAEGVPQGRRRTAGWFAFNMARVEAETPWWRTDFGDGASPHETGVLSSRVSFTKGCYPGQEVVARMEHLGHPKQILRALRMPDERLPIAGAQVFVDEDGPPGNPVGVVTSSAPAPLRSNASTALAVLKWAQAEPGSRVRCTADGDMVPVAVSECSQTGGLAL